MESYIGVDVGKHQLEIYHQGHTFSVPNTKIGIQKFIQHLDLSEDSVKVAFEATGGYERLLKASLQKKGGLYCTLHPNKVRAFAKAKGLLAKTDKIDAQLIAHYADIMKIEQDLPETNQALKELLKRRQQLIEDKNRESHRLDKEYSHTIKRSIEKHIAWLAKEIKAIEEKLKESHANQHNQIALLTSIPGIGELTACYLLAYMPEIKTGNQGQLAALTGIAPMNRDSGSYRGKRFIQGGRSPLRRALYLAAVPSVRFNHDLKRFYERLRNKGKPANLALVAVMRKLLLMAAAVLKRQTPWQAIAPSTA